MNTVDKTPEQPKTEEQILKEWKSQPWSYSKGTSSDYEERQLLPEPDFHLISLEQAGKLPNQTLQELLISAEKIEKWLNEPKRLKEEARQKSIKRHQEMMDIFTKK